MYLEYDIHASWLSTTKCNWSLRHRFERKIKLYIDENRKRIVTFSCEENEIFDEENENDFSWGEKNVLIKMGMKNEHDNKYDDCSSSSKVLGFFTLILVNVVVFDVDQDLVIYGVAATSTSD